MSEERKPSLTDAMRRADAGQKQDEAFANELAAGFKELRQADHDRRPEYDRAVEAEKLGAIPARPTIDLRNASAEAQKAVAAELDTDDDRFAEYYAWPIGVAEPFQRRGSYDEALTDANHWLRLHPASYVRILAVAKTVYLQIAEV